ncbi:uncharacterized protein LOC120189927 [Hibiscus syriacus]|uniref:uncharacterized protein LOC120189927 n=1 Tax=Hibiscus syriacus TaxID=106335 RepID=UPI001920B152|nr:uncharacterized protein LOC120189927 [Hibiscus syriacus]
MLILKELKSLGAPEFRGEKDEGPMETDLWLNDVMIIFESLHYSDSEKLGGIVSLLRGSARFRRAMLIKFLNLKQSNRAVHEYKAEYNKLSSFAAEVVPNDKTRRDQFIERLRQKLKEMMTAFHLQIDGKSEQTIQILEDLLKARVIEFKGSWERCGDTRYFIRDCPLMTGELAQSERYVTVPQKDWLYRYHTNIDCRLKRVVLRSSNGSEVVVVSERINRLANVIFVMSAKKLMLQGCQAFIANMIDTRFKERGLEDILSVREFPDVFPAELPGVPPDREVEFQIEVLPRTTPISVAPYRIAPKELSELKTQLQ